MEILDVVDKWGKPTGECVEREVAWFDFKDCMKKVEKNEIPHCIFMEELKILDEKLFDFLL